MKKVYSTLYFATLLISFLILTGCSGGGGGNSVTPEPETEAPVDTDPAGGDTSGGDTSGGDTSGGDTSGGDTSGGDTSGGDTSGGDTSGGDTSGGDTSGGDTSGGDTSGGDTSGGDTSGGDTSGGSDISGVGVPISGTGATGLSAIGTNLASVNDYTQSTPFIDLMLSARPFPEQTWRDIDDVEYDDQGWPIKLNGDRALTVLHMSSPQQQAYVGDYVVLYDGVGRLEYESAASIKSRSPGRDVITFKPVNADDAIFLYVAELDEQNPIKNIKILLPGGICADDMYVRVNSAEACVDSPYLSFEENHERILFNPDFLAYVRNFSSLRFMDWSKVIGSGQIDWSENRKLTDITWTSFSTNKGVPIEVMVSLANLTNVDPWFTIPHLATDDHIRQYAQYIKSALSPDLTPYIEYSNEVWNGQYSQYDHAEALGLILELDEVPWAANNKYYSRRSVEMFKIWEEVYGNTSSFTRVISSQYESEFRSNQILEFEDAYKNVDALAIGPYFRPYAACADEPSAYNSVDDVFAAINGCKEQWGAWLDLQAALAERFGVDLIAYEGGQHLVSSDNERLEELYAAANRDPRMAAQYVWHWDRWRSAGGKHFAVYTSPTIYNLYGSFGMKEYITQPRSEAPKYDAMLNWIDANTIWW